MTRAVLLMAYGTPATLDDVEPYFTHIRGGRATSAEAVARLRSRYERVGGGGGTPLLRVTESLRDRLEGALAAEGETHRVYVGMKHWHPFIADTMRRMKDDGVREVTCVALAPHFSRMSIGAYRHAVEESQAALGEPFVIRIVERWYANERFVAMMAAAVRDGLDRFPASARDDVAVVFTAHSLPVRIREWQDPYEGELAESAKLVAQRAGLAAWRSAWQSAGGTPEPWIGPDMLEYLETLQAEGVQNVLQVPIGFVADHLEILYDIDIEAKARASALGMRLERTELPNDSPAFVRVLADVVRAPTAGPAA